MTDLRKLAQGKPCQVRLEGCDGGGETTVLAHYRLAGLCGAGMKPPDLIGAHACARCHDLIDGRVHIANLTHDDVRLAHAEGCFRTQAFLLSKAYVR